MIFDIQCERLVVNVLFLFAGRHWQLPVENSIHIELSRILLSFTSPSRTQFWRSWLSFAISFAFSLKGLLFEKVLFDPSPGLTGTTGIALKSGTGVGTTVWSLVWAAIVWRLRRQISLRKFHLKSYRYKQKGEIMENPRLANPLIVINKLQIVIYN